jgi:phosphoenolpyruvate phosphomutase
MEVSDIGKCRPQTCTGPPGREGASVTPLDDGAPADAPGLFQGKSLVLLAGAHDAISARIAVKQGFDAIWVSGFGVTNALGLLDEGIITLTEMMDAAWRVKQSVRCPVVVDCDTGYGDATNVLRLAKEASVRRIDAVCLEDQKFPKRNTFLDGKHQLEDIDRFCDKIAAAASGRGSDRLLVVARSEAIAQGYPVTVALERAVRYAAAGADAILVQSVTSNMDSLGLFAGGWDGPQPLGLIATSLRNIGFEEMHRAGFSFAVYANQGLRSAVKAMNDTYAKIFKSGGKQVEINVASMQEILSLQSDREWS